MSVEKVRKQKRVAAKTDRPLKVLLGGGKRFYANYKGWVFNNGRIKYDGKIYDSPSTVGSVVRGGKSTNS